METRRNRPDRLKKEICNRDDPFVRDDYMETGLYTLIFVIKTNYLMFFSYIVVTCR